MIIIYFIATFIVAYLLGMKTVTYSISHKSKKEKKKVESIYIEILENSEEIKFTQRVQEFVQFTSNNYMLVYLLDKREVSIFKDDMCVATPGQIDPKLNEKLVKYLDIHFKKDIEDIISIDGYIISKSYYEDMINSKTTSRKRKKEKVELNLDDILDKISKTGIGSLTKNELNYLNKFSND